MQGLLASRSLCGGWHFCHGDYLEAILDAEQWLSSAIAQQPCACQCLLSQLGVSVVLVLVQRP